MKPGLRIGSSAGPGREQTRNLERGVVANPPGTSQGTRRNIRRS